VTLNHFFLGRKKSDPQPLFFGDEKKVTLNHFFLGTKKTTFFQKKPLFFRSKKRSLFNRKKSTEVNFKKRHFFLRARNAMHSVPCHSAAVAAKVSQFRGVVF
jgi:hypothetical protein